MGKKLSFGLRWNDKNVPCYYDTLLSISLGPLHPIGSELHTHFVIIYSKMLTEYPLVVGGNER